MDLPKSFQLLGHTIDIQYDGEDVVKDTDRAYLYPDRKVEFSDSAVGAPPSIAPFALPAARAIPSTNICAPSVCSAVPTMSEVSKCHLYQQVHQRL